SGLGSGVRQHARPRAARLPPDPDRAPGSILSAAHLRVYLLFRRRERRPEQGALERVSMGPEGGPTHVARRLWALLHGRTDRGSVGAALAALKEAEARPVEPELRAKLLSLGQALLDSIGMQLSVPLFGASGEERGAILDHLDTPLGNQPWLQAELTKVAAVTDD